MVMLAQPLPWTTEVSTWVQSAEPRLAWPKSAQRNGSDLEAGSELPRFHRDRPRATSTPKSAPPSS